jgi:hypothetical protein
MVRVPCAVRLISVWPSQSLDGVRVRGAALFLDGIEPLWEVHVLQHTRYVRCATDNGCTCHATYAGALCIDGFEPLWEVGHSTRRTAAAQGDPRRGWLLACAALSSRECAGLVWPQDRANSEGATLSWQLAGVPPTELDLIWAKALASVVGEAELSGATLNGIRMMTKGEYSAAYSHAAEYAVAAPVSHIVGLPALRCTRCTGEVYKLEFWMPRVPADTASIAVCCA